MGSNDFTKRCCVTMVLSFVFLSGLQQAAAISVGDIAPDFTLLEHGTDNWVSLRDYEGEVIVLDFFTEWCGPCKTAASELEPYIQQYFDNRGGNDHGVPVRLISISLDNDPPEKVDDYINIYGLDLVLDDPYWNAYSTYSVGSIPRFAIINGAQSINYDQWEVLYLYTGYGAGRYTTFRDYINSVIPASPASPGDANLDGTVDVSDLGILATNYNQGGGLGWEHGDFTGDGFVGVGDLGILATYYVSSASPGDANRDGTVDVIDLGILATNYGTSGKVWEQGDFTGEGDVDVSDLGILATNYGNTAATAVQSVPEPGTLALLATCGLTAWPLLVGMRRRRAHHSILDCIME